jgi:succinylglutamate desuccinylase
MGYLAEQLEIFRNFLSKSTGDLQISEVGPHIFKLSPKNLATRKKLGFIGLVHGNEIIGLPVLNGLLQKIFSKEIEPQFEMFFALGNLEAAHAEKRCIEYDLNRAFGKNSDEFLETRRARELEQLMLNHCDHVIDFHQTVSPTQKSFFIFEYSKGLDLEFLRKVNPGIPAIVQFEAIGDESGLSTDEYLLRRGKFGSAVELGQMGFSEPEYKLGLQIGLRAVDVYNGQFTVPRENFQFFQLAGRYKALASGDALNATYENFQKIKRGEVVGEGKFGKIEAPESGYLLFPRAQPALHVGQELFYYCTEYELKKEEAILASSTSNNI